MKTRKATYAGNHATRVPTTKHHCIYSTPVRVKGNSARMGCRHCPRMDRWYKITDYTLATQELIRDIKKERRVNIEPEVQKEFRQIVRNDPSVGDHELTEDNQRTPEERLYIALNTMTKPVILEAYPNYGLFKSWTKEKMIEVVMEKELQG